MMEKISYFLNDRMKVLIVLNEHQININGVMVCPMNQQEIADNIGCSKVKLNQIMKELVETGYVNVFQKGRYLLTEDALKVIKQLKLGE